MVIRAMGGEREDRRVKYSKRVLKESLIKLLQQKPADKISVTELCALSGLNRSTFYAHYGSPSDLLLQVEREVLDALDRYLERFNVIDSKTEVRQTIRRIFDYITENADLCRVLLADNGDRTFQKKLLNYVQQQVIREPLAKAAGDADRELIEYVSRFSIDGCVGIIQKWLEKGMTKTPEEMADIIIKLIYQGLSAYLVLKQ